MPGENALPENLGVALNEATWLALRLRPERREVALDFDVFTLPDGAGGEGHRRVTLLLGSVARIVASLRLGRWDDSNARVVSVSAAELASVVTSFGSKPVYGWDFFDRPEASWDDWRDRLSLDARWAEEPAAHSLDLFQECTYEGQDRHLDFRAWFAGLDVLDQDSQRVALDDFTAGGERWWKAFNANDPRTTTFDMYPLKPS